jgi:hypothetical protein
MEDGLVGPTFASLFHWVIYDFVPVHQDRHIIEFADTDRYCSEARHVRFCSSLKSYSSFLIICPLSVACFPLIIDTALLSSKRCRKQNKAIMVSKNMFLLSNITQVCVLVERWNWWYHSKLLFAASRSQISNNFFSWLAVSFGSVTA